VERHRDRRALADAERVSARSASCAFQARMLGDVVAEYAGNARS